ncbi:L,D-transpeptidase family protein [Rufibacter roseus]|uniref:Murein L,D-transpeptidase n=1 Tax=Rufibacter roseus TaxID=1567108 RepID=A0ABW2DMW9_9BACT|nr:L,D-transpeptidase family protein [Rufibacter roseus]
MICLFLINAPVSAQSEKTTGATSHLSADTLRADSAFVHQYVQQQEEYRQHLPLVEKFYQSRRYQLAWFRNGKLVSHADKLIEAIEHARKEGLNPKDYRVKNIREAYRAFESMSQVDPRKEKTQQELDVALTASYFNYASDFYKGTVDPHSTSAIEWEIRKNKIKLDKALTEILAQKDSTHPFYEFEALHQGYQKLREALVRYRQIKEQGGWSEVKGQDIVKPNDTAQVVVEVRKRLLPQQTVQEQDTAFWVYDLQVETAVKDFQKRHGLTVDGILGPQTYGALNVSVDERIDQILLNMERWRWLPKDLDADNSQNRYVMVNIPGFRVSVYEDGKEALRMKAVVGKTMHATPIFSHQIQYLMFSPYWNVPNSIVEEEIAPKLQRNRNWLSSQNMEMVNTFGPNARRIPVSRVNWYTMTRHNFKYRIRQRPGPNNALGRVKFMFPNEYAVYLHDTPADHLFSEAGRDFSHGCVRVERPAELATYLLQEKPGWNRNRVENAMNASTQQRVDLPENVPVYLVYFTAWVEDDGTVHFRDDIYGHDKALAQRYF